MSRVLLPRRSTRWQRFGQRWAHRKHLRQLNMRHVAELHAGAFRVEAPDADVSASILLAVGHDGEHLSSGEK